MTVSVIGAGLAGCEAAWQLACPRYSGNIARDEAGQVFPCAPVRGICGIGLLQFVKSQQNRFGRGLLKEEMYRLGSIVVRWRPQKQRYLPAGALAVDRICFLTV